MKFQDRTAHSLFDDAGFADVWRALQLEWKDIPFDAKRRVAQAIAEYDDERIELPDPTETGKLSEWLEEAHNSASALLGSLVSIVESEDAPTFLGSFYEELRADVRRLPELCRGLRGHSLPSGGRGTPTPFAWVLLVEKLARVYEDSTGSIVNRSPNKGGFLSFVEQISRFANPALKSRHQADLVVYFRDDHCRLPESGESWCYVRRKG